MARTLVIGDIHGCLVSLDELWRKISPLTTEDTVVFLGDYIDRGPQSRQVIDFILGVRGGEARVITLMGNHEQMLLDFLQGRDDNGYLEFGGKATLASYGHEGGTARDFCLPEGHERFLHELLPYWQNEWGIYVHAGLKPGCPLALQPRSWLYWVKEDFRCENYDFGKPVIYGHTVYREPRLTPHCIGIDTGAVYGGLLTCLVLPERTFIQVAGAPHWPRR